MSLQAVAIPGTADYWQLAAEGGRPQSDPVTTEIHVPYLSFRYARPAEYSAGQLSEVTRNLAELRLKIEVRHRFPALVTTYHLIEAL